MKRLFGTLHDFLDKTGGLRDITFGDTTKVSVTEEDRDWLIEQFKSDVKFNRNLVKTLIVLHLVIFIVAVILCVVLWENTNGILPILGLGTGTGLGVLKLLDRLKDLWREKSMIDTLMVIIPNLPLKEATETIQSIYFNIKNNKNTPEK